MQNSRHTKGKEMTFIEALKKAKELHNKDPDSWIEMINYTLELQHSYYLELGPSPECVENYLGIIDQDVENTDWEVHYQQPVIVFE